LGISLLGDVFFCNLPFLVNQKEKVSDIQCVLLFLARTGVMNSKLFILLDKELEVLEFLLISLTSFDVDAVKMRMSIHSLLNFASHSVPSRIE
jgi:hypothetical protein